MIITKDKTVINSPPSSVTAHSGMLLQNPTALILSTISCGNVVEVNPPVPAAPMARDTMPCTMSKTASISSRPYCTAAFARTNRMNSFSACSGLRASAKLPQVFTTPTAKNSTSRPRPMAVIALCTFSMTFHTPPPLKSASPCVRSCQISASFSFQVLSAAFRLSMIHEFSPMRLHPLPHRSVRFFHTHATPINARISRAKVITSPPASVRKPWLL